MTLLTRPKRDRLSKNDVEWLGEEDGHAYAVFAGDEYQFGRRPLAPEFRADPLRSGEIRIVEPQIVVEDGHRFESSLVRQGWRVPHGTFARLVAARRKREPRAAKRKAPRPVNVVSTLLIAQPRGGHAVRTAPASEMRAERQEDGSVRVWDPEALGLRPRTPAAILTPATEPARTFRDVLERIYQLGNVLTVVGDGLRCDPPGGRPRDDVSEAIDKLEAEFVAILRGDPPMCAYRHKQSTEAVTRLFPSALVCEEHADA